MALPHCRETSVCSGIMESTLPNENPLKSHQTRNLKMRSLTGTMPQIYKTFNKIKTSTQEKVSKTKPGSFPLQEQKEA